jgi:uncharacterized membrane protein
MSERRNTKQAIRWFVIITWLLYALTFFPFKLPKEYAVQWLFTVVALFGVFGVCALTYWGNRRWKLVSVLAAIALLAIYLAYWISITETARETQPQLASPVALGHILEQGVLIGVHLWGRGAVIGAGQIVYFEIAMPILQTVALIWIAVTTSRSTHT